ncbi:MAG: Ig-like domain-containing protein [Tannerella sp.]|jgi:hypothetical protein|nr:Ig-like domain-containing protein [Tannerella sp.]
MKPAIQYTLNRFIPWIPTGISVWLFASCANMASPNGGPYDELPPRVIRSTPGNGETHVKGRTIEIVFDELIQVERPSENVIITPPQKLMPEILALGKKIKIELKDSLIPDVTYTIDFTNSVADNNEKNVLENFGFAFSTGERLDSLEISGIVLNAANLEPMPNIMVGLHSDLADSAFTTAPFFRTSKTNDRGRFTIRNIAEGRYRLFALNDANRDYLFDQPGEDIAFHDSVITPYFELRTRQDTIWKDSLTIDSVRTVGYTHFLPDNATLRLFREAFRRQYMLRPERADKYTFTLNFNAPTDTLPALSLTDNPPAGDWYLVRRQQDENAASFRYWITDSLVYNRDTLHLQVSYLKSDSLNILRPQTDTLHLALRRQPAERSRRREREPEPVAFLSMQTNASDRMEVYDTLSVTFDEPVATLDSSVFVLEQKQDTLWIPADFTLRQDSNNLLKYCLMRPFGYGEQFRLTVDSARISGIYGKWNDASLSTIRIKQRDSYGDLFLKIEGIEGAAFVELLNTGDAPVRKSTVREGWAIFTHLKPDKYYVRLIEDTNDNGVWDTGNYAEKRQPENVWYAPRFYEIPANFEIEESWSPRSTPIERQKLPEITKNKPKDVTKKKRDYRQEGQQQSARSSNPFGGISF